MCVKLLVELTYQTFYDSNVKFSFPQNFQISPLKNGSQNKFQDICELISTKMLSQPVWLPNCITYQTVNHYWNMQFEQFKTSRDKTFRNLWINAESWRKNMPQHVSQHMKTNSRRNFCRNIWCSFKKWKHVVAITQNCRKIVVKK